MTTCCSGSAGAAVTRRDVATVAGVGLATAALAPARALAADRAVVAGQGKPADAVEPFAPGEVQLLDGPLLDARRRTEAYLLSLDADRLLAGYLHNAGLPSKGAVYGGWESAPMWTDIHCQGHTLGHYLSACALIAGSTRDARFARRVRYVTNELARCQRASGSGLLCAFPEGPGLVAAFIAGGKVTGVPWYTIHKTAAGLRDAWRIAGDDQARDVLVRLADWAIVATRSLDDARFEAMLDVEHGGMNEVFADLYAATGRDDYRRMAVRFSHKAILAPLARGQDHLDGLHANTQIPKVVGFERIAATTGAPDYGDAAAFFWRTVVDTRSYATGGHGDGEHFFPVADGAAHAFSAKGSETCGQYNMLKLTRMLFAREPRAELGDYYERTLFNGILGSQDPQSGMVTYFQGARPGYMKLYCTPVDSFWCCTGTGMENHASYDAAIYFRRDNALYVNLFIPSVATWRSKGATLTQTTGFPDAASTRLAWRLDRPTALSLRLRHPGWSRTAIVRVNGAEVVRSDRPGSFVALDRTWRDGDVVELDLAMAVDASTLPGAPDVFALTYGPLVLAAALGAKEIAPGSDLVVNERKYGEYLDAPFVAPRLAGEPHEIAARVRPAGGPLRFTVADADGRAIALMPYHRIAHQRYATYWWVDPAGSHAAAVA
jgi:hypothetical protein